MPTSALRAVSSRVARRLLRRWTERQPPEWEALECELDLWAKRGRHAAFWWRDDDDRVASPALDRLLDLAARFEMPLALAVIPVGAEPSLPARLAREARVRVFQHGWDHVNRAASGLPAELGPTRDPDEVAKQLLDGRQRLHNLFAARFLPVLVPPFNQLSGHLYGAVERVGYRFISSQGDFGCFPLASRNTHLDVIDWQRNAVADPSAVVRSALAALKLRRLGIVSPGLPVGMVTHHLVHDTAVWHLVEELLRRVAPHPAIDRPSIERIFAA